LQSAEKWRFAFCKVFWRKISTVVLSALKITVFIEKISFQKFGTPLAKRFSGRADLHGRNKNKIYMSTLTAKGNWNIAKGKIKQKLAQLADDDLQFIEGKEDELVGRIQKRTGQAGRKIESTARECSSCRIK
jgi:uncharacterized protein YjbJ (UPF0337 family)